MAIFITGDAHGDFKRFENTIFYEQVGLTKKDCVIICGDMGGIWDGSPEEQHQLDWLEQRPYTTLFVSGNHENYGLLAEYPVEDWNGGQVQRIRPSVIHLMRGQVYDIQGKKFFTMGGASSHDISGRFYKADALTDFLDEITQRCQFRYHCFGHYHTNTVIRKNMFCCMSRLFAKTVIVSVNSGKIMIGEQLC